MMDHMRDRALLAGDCAAEDRFVFAFVRLMQARCPVGLARNKALALAQALLDEAYTTGTVPSDLSRASLARAAECARVSERYLPAMATLLSRRGALPETRPVAGLTAAA